MLICDAHRVVYLTPPRTGASAIAAVLTDVPYRGVWHSSGLGYRQPVWDTTLDDCYTFITTRHPYTRALSYWRTVQRHILSQMMKPTHGVSLVREYWAKAYGGKLPTFLEFWDNYSDKSHQNTFWRASWYSEQWPKPVDSVVHQEHLNAEFNEIQLFRGWELRRTNADIPTARPWTDYFTPEVLTRVVDNWGQDFETFGYTLDFNACARGQVWADISVG